MESHLGVKVPGPNFKGIESPDGLDVKRAGSKTIFEMIDLEGVSPSLSPSLLFTRTNTDRFSFSCLSLLPLIFKLLHYIYFSTLYQNMKLTGRSLSLPSSALYSTSLHHHNFLETNQYTKNNTYTI